MTPSISARPRQGILVLQLAKLGDFLQTRAFLNALASSHPHERPKVLLLDRRVAAALPRSFQPPDFEIKSLAVENLTRAARVKPWPKALRALAGELESIAPAGFKTVYNLNTAPLPALLARLTGARELRGPQLNPDLKTFKPYPAQEMVLSLRGRRRLGRFNLVDLWRSLIPGRPPRPPAPALIEPSSPHATWASLGLAPPDRDKLTVGFQMGAAHPSRSPGPDFLLEVAAQLGRPGFCGKPLGRLALLGSQAAEQRAAADFMSRWPRPELAVNLTGRTSLCALAGILSGLDLFLTGDTGAMHLAVALRTPTLALFQGPAWAPETAPYAAGVVIHQTLAACGPCLENGACPQGGTCLAHPDPKIIAQAARRILAAPEGEGPSLAWTETSRFWRTSFDRFGLTLKPWASRPPMSLEELWALALREAGRTVFQPAYQTEPAELAAEAALYDLSGLNQPRPGSGLASLKEMSLAVNFLEQPAFRARFEEVFNFVASRQ